MTNQEYKSRKRIITVMACIMSLVYMRFDIMVWEVMVNSGRWFAYVILGPICVLMFLMAIMLPFGKRRDFENEYGKR